MDKISLLIVEDHEIFAKILLDVLQRDEMFQIAGVVQTAEEGLAKLGELSVDLVLVDIGLPGMDGITLVRNIHDQYPSLPCVMISGYFSAAYAQKSLQAGARGYLLKDNVPGILEGIKTVIRGEIYVSKELGEGDFGSSQS